MRIDSREVLKQFRVVERHDCVVGQYDGYQDDPVPWSIW